MKTNLLLKVCILLFAFFSCKSTVKKIEYDSYNQKVLYKNYKNITVEEKRAHVSEGSKVDLTIHNFNPINEEFSINQATPVVFYVNNPSPLLGTLGIKVDEKVAKNGDKTDYLTKQITDYATFHNSLANFYFQFQTLQRLNTINPKEKSCLCDLMQELSYKINANLNSQENDPAQTKKVCFADSNCCNNVLLLSSANLSTLKSQIIQILKDSLIAYKKTDTIEENEKKLTKLLDDYQDRYESQINMAIDAYYEIQSIQLIQSFNNLPVENTDEFKLTITVNNKIKNKSLTYPITLPVRKWVKIDFSAGVFYSWLSSQNYEIKKSNDTMYKIHSFDEYSFAVGPMGAINLHTYICPGFKAGLFVGSGLLFNDNVKVMFSGGLSFIFGKYQRVIIHGGFATSKVTTVSDMYEGKEFKDATYKPQLNSKWDNAFMIGLTWNLNRN